MKILIGSRALDYRTEGAFRAKYDADWDIVTDEKIDVENQRIELHAPDVLLNSELEKYCNEKDKINFNGNILYVPSLKGLAIVKRSHLWRDWFFDKHMFHYNKFLKNSMSDLSEADKDYLRRRTEESYKYFKERHPVLNQSVEDFFDDYVDKKYNHDWLHSLFAYNEQPMYTYMQIDKSKAWCEKQLWDMFSYENQIKAVAEEAYVIATERFLVPNNWNYSSKLAFLKALNKICTTLCSGWFRDFAIDNYDQVMLQYDVLKFDRVKWVLLTQDRVSN